MKLKHTLTTLAALACMGLGVAHAETASTTSPAARSDVQNDARDAMKSGSIAPGPKSTPNQDKGGTAGYATGSDPAAASTTPMKHGKKHHKAKTHTSSESPETAAPTSAGEIGGPGDTSGQTPRPGASVKNGVGASGEGPGIGSDTMPPSPTSTPRKSGY
jgi:hypothetical protein